jgi:hypothetical protein
MRVFEKGGEESHFCQTSLRTEFEHLVDQCPQKHRAASIAIKGSARNSGPFAPENDYRENIGIVDTDLAQIVEGLAKSPSFCLCTSARSKDWVSSAAHWGQLAQ